MYDVKAVDCIGVKNDESHVTPFYPLQVQVKIGLRLDTGH